MKQKEKTPYIAPLLELLELQNERGFAQSGNTEEFSEDPEGSWL